MTGSYRIGDALTLARELPDDSVDCIVTSPPYWGLRSYLAGDDPSKSLEMGAEPTLAEYVERLVVLFRELRRALKDDGTCWLNLGDSYASSPPGCGGFSKSSGLSGAASANYKASQDLAGGSKRDTIKGSGLKPKDLCLVPYRVALALQDDGWWLRSNIVWHKPNPMPESVTDRPTSAHEALFLLAKSARYFYDADAVKEEAGPPGGNGFAGRQGGSRGLPMSGGAGTEDRWDAPTRNKRNVWTIATKPYSGSHYAVMPPALVEPCVKAGCPAKVCAECGAPWVRVMERTAMVVRPGPGRGPAMGTSAGATSRTQVTGTMLSPPTSKTTGCRATCDHDADTRPGLVLDPFGGSGTVGMVAESLGRRWLMFDLDQRNADLMHKRTAQRSLLGLLA